MGKQIGRKKEQADAAEQYRLSLLMRQNNLYTKQGRQRTTMSDKARANERAKAFEKLNEVEQSWVKTGPDLRTNGSGYALSKAGAGQTYGPDGKPMNLETYYHVTRRTGKGARIGTINGKPRPLLTYKEDAGWKAANEKIRATQWAVGQGARKQRKTDKQAKLSIFGVAGASRGRGTAALLDDEDQRKLV